MPHLFEMPQNHIDRVIERQGREHTCESFDTRKTALVVVDRAELKFELQGSGGPGAGAGAGGTESSELGIQYRVFVTLAAYEANAESIASEWITDNNVSSVSTDLKTTAYDKLKTMTNTFTGTITDI